jgi:hypothetical protein
MPGNPREMITNRSFTPIAVATALTARTRVTCGFS